MSSTVEKTYRSCWSDNQCRGNWSGRNIAAMVIAFVFFWPLGLVILYWTLTGRNVKTLPGAIRDRMSGLFGGFGSASGRHNVVFDEYQQTQYDRIREIKTEIKERAQRFDEFRADVKRRADEEEFNQFMASSPGSQ